MQVRKESVAFDILRLLCYTEEYPKQCMELIGDGRDSWRKRVLRQLTEEGYIRLIKYDRSIQSYGIVKKGFLVVYPHRDYQKRRVSPAIVNRLHRIAEAAALMDAAGIRIYPEDKPDWLGYLAEPKKREQPVFWSSREIKANLDLERNFNSSRFVGLLTGSDQPYVIYNVKSGQMRWHDGAEAHTRALINRMVRAPTDNAIILGQSMEYALEILQTSPDARSCISVRTSYPNMYYLPLAREAAPWLQYLSKPAWRQTLVDELLTREEQAGRRNTVENDGAADVRGIQMPVLVGCDCNLPQLYRLKAALDLRRIEAAAVICMPWQKKVYETFFGFQAIILTVDEWRRR